MAGENVEAVRRWLELNLSSDPDVIRTAVTEFCEPDVDYYPARKFLEALPCHGRDEFVKFLVRFRESWSRFEWAVNELIEVGDDRVLAWLSMRAEGSESGMNLEGDLYCCYWWRNGRLFREEDHLTLSGALRAFGLQGGTLEAAGLRAPSNLDLVRSILKAWESGDFTSVDWADPEIEYVVADGPEPGSWTGLAGLSEAAATGLRAWKDYRVEVDEYRELDDERVLFLFHGMGRGKTSGLDLGQLPQNSAYVFYVREGKVTKLVFYMSRDRALADLGLAAEAGS
jgi:ketosteroid isomerase-like protein